MMNKSDKVTFKQWKEELKYKWTDKTKRKVMKTNVMMFFGKLMRTVILIGLCFVILLPIFQKISAAVRDRVDITNPNVVWIPENFSMFNINFALELLDFKHTIWNTLIVSTGCTLLQIFSCSLAGYAFARLKFKGRNIIFYLVLLTLVVPNESLHRSRSLFLNNFSFFGIKLIGNTLSMFLLSIFGQGIRSAIFIFLFRQFFKNIPNIRPKLQALSDVGLGYIKLGQSSTTLSGGEAQRVKLATELAKRGTGKTLYILDEPTTGLHMYDVKKLINILQTFVEKGNSVVVIEHNLDVIKVADYIIDLGPEGGDGGGEIIAQGNPEKVAKSETSHTAKYLRKILTKEKNGN